MDLGTIVEKLDRYQYKSRNAFIRDLNLIWVNCIKYNTTQGHPLRKMALTMRHKIKELVPSIPDLVVFRESPRSRGLPRIEVALYDHEDSDYEPIVSSQGQPALGPGSKLWEDRSVQECRVFPQPRPDSLGGPTRLSLKDSVLNDNTVQNYAKGFLTNKSTSHKGESQRGDGNEQHHPSLTRERHPIYGNSIFSENRSVYRTDDTGDRFKDSVFERELAKRRTLSTYTYPGGRGKGQKTRSTSVDALEDRKSSREPSEVAIPATSGSAYKLNDSTYGDEIEQTGNPHEKFKCSHTDYFEQPPLFSRRSESA